jgi:putative ATP-binding cassette transporter
MQLLQLAAREVKISVPRLCVFATLAGVSNALIIAMINTGATTAARGEVDRWAAMVFILSLLLYVWSQRFLFSTTSKEVEAAIHRLRLRLMDDVRHSELASLEAIGRADIYANITKQTATLTQAAVVITVAVQSSVLIFFTAIYVAYLSLVAFAMSAIVIGLAAGMFLARSQKIRQDTLEGLRWENRLFERLTDLLSGFKEVRLNKYRSDDLFDDLSAVSSTAADLKIRNQIDASRQFIFSQSAFYVMLGAVVFAVPSFSPTFGDSIMKISTALLFIIGSISSVVQSIPTLASANAAAENIVRLEDALRGAAAQAVNGEFKPLRRFSRIEMLGVRFEYSRNGPEGNFHIGPVDFKLDAGETVFITGGNGSGKSTFLKVLTRLYEPNGGQMLIDGKRITAMTRESYRNLFTAVYSDYHLFKRPYGLRDVDPFELDRLLAKFELSGKTDLINGEFTTLDLSAGQRKRLALVVGLLEQRPILVLDEWTADQDPIFRRRYYEDLVPELQRSGKTLVAVTHDERLLADIKIPIRQLRMDEGRFV